MNEYIDILQKMFDKYERKPDVYGKLLTLETKILIGRCDYENNKR